MLSVLLAFSMKVLGYCLVLLVGVWCWFQWAYKDMISSASKVPVTLRTLPILGHAHYTVLGMDRVTRYALDMVLAAVAQGLPNLCFWCGPLPLVIVNEMEDIQKLLNSSVTSEKGDEMKYLKFALGNGLLTAPGDIWRTTRRYMNYLFHPRNVEQLVPLFNNSSRELVSVLSQHVNRGPVEVMHYNMDVSLKTVCHLIFGHDININMNSKSFHNLKTAVESLPDLATRRIARLWLRSDTIFNFLYKKELKHISDSWKNFTEETLKASSNENPLKKQKTNFLQENGLNGNIASLTEGTIDLQDVYSVLIKDHPQFTERDMWFEMMTIYTTGTDTVAAAASSCLLTLAQYQDIQERVYQEIISVMGPDDDVTQEDLNRMPYLDQVLQETLRWFTIVPFVLRKPKEDIELSSCKILKGCTVILALIGIHKDPKIYPDPHKFDPDRFESNKVDGNKRYTFLPFSGGPRNCIGKLYSNLMVKTMLVHVLRRFKLSTKMDINTMRRKLTITLVSAEGYNISLESRS